MIRLTFCSGILLTAALVGAQEMPFAPSPSRMEDGGLAEAARLATSGSCGFSGCHPDIAEQWAASAHHFSSFTNPYYKRSVELLLSEPDGVSKTRWCAGCHDPVLLLSGQMQEKPDLEHELGGEGVGCLLCHAIAEPDDARGNGGYTLRDLDPVPLDERGGFLPALGRAWLKRRSAPHAEMLLRPQVRTSEMCRACHKVSIPPEVNDYRWRRGQNEYDAWHASGVSGHNNLSFFLRPKPAECIDCHMPEVASQDQGNDAGQVANHRFAAANTALPFLRGDRTQLDAVEHFLRDGAMRVSVAAVANVDEDELADLSALRVQGGDDLRFYVVVRNANVGHAFPGGTIDSHEAWLEVELRDAQGRVLLASGFADSTELLPANTRVYRARILDDEAHSLMHRNVQHWVATGYANTVGPGSADVARYRLRLPEDVALPITWSARLLYRKFQPPLSAFVFDGEIPPLPITEVAAERGTLGRPRAEDARATADRWNDLGIALFLQEDRLRARDCFARAAALQPERADLWLNQARVALGDGDLPLAGELLEQAHMRDAEHPTLRRLRARLAALEGDYPRSIALLEALTVADRYDRGSWAELGDSYYFSGRFEDALGAYDAILAIDPESLIAHNGRLLSLRALGRDFAEAAAAVEKYKPAESERALAGHWLRANPQENQNAQRIWEYWQVEHP